MSAPPSDWVIALRNLRDAISLCAHRLEAERGADIHSLHARLSTALAASGSFPLDRANAAALREELTMLCDTAADVVRSGLGDGLGEVAMDAFRQLEMATRIAQMVLAGGTAREARRGVDARQDRCSALRNAGWPCARFNSGASDPCIPAPRAKPSHLGRRATLPRAQGRRRRRPRRPPSSAGSRASTNRTSPSVVHGPFGTSSRSPSLTSIAFAVCPSALARQFRGAHPRFS